MEKPLTRPFFIRNLGAGQLLETFLVSAVAAFLGVRFFLGVTGYPRLGGGGLHIAHMLWGGTLMVAGVLMLLSYLGQRIRRAAAVIAGLGFGLFIDELGKFITSDNNYFYRPAIALIYVVFVLLFLWWRSLERHRVWDEQTYLANALMLLQDAALHDLDPTEKYHLIRWLRQRGATGTTLLGNIEQEVAARRPDLPRRSPLGARLRWIQRRVEGILRSRWTGRIAIALLLIRLLAAVTASLALVYAPDAWRRPRAKRKAKDSLPRLRGRVGWGHPAAREASGPARRRLRSGRRTASGRRPGRGAGSRRATRAIAQGPRRFRFRRLRAC